MASDDQFFEEETEIGASRAKSAHAPATAPAAKGGKNKGASGKKGATKPPSFAMVVGIAVAALVLGYCLGYFVCISTTSNKIQQKYDNLASEYSSEVNEEAVSSMVAAASATGESAAAAANVNEEAGLPEGHPDLSSMVNEDGSINEEAVEAYKAQMSAAKDAQN